MNFFKSLFGNKAENEEEKRREEERKNFETLKYDGVRALQEFQNVKGWWPKWERTDFMTNSVYEQLLNL